MKEKKRYLLLLLSLPFIVFVTLPQNHHPSFASLKRITFPSIVVHSALTSEMWDRRTQSWIIHGSCAAHFLCSVRERGLIIESISFSFSLVTLICWLTHKKSADEFCLCYTKRKRESDPQHALFRVCYVPRFCCCCCCWRQQPTDNNNHHSLKKKRRRFRSFRGFLFSSFLLRLT